jgi:hypothetical protein
MVPHADLLLFELEGFPDLARNEFRPRTVSIQAAEGVRHL